MPANGSASSFSLSDLIFSQNVALNSPREPVWLVGSDHTIPCAEAVRGPFCKSPAIALPGEWW